MSKCRDCEERFCERYSAPVAGAALIVEREAIGANFGANGYTTVSQANMLAKRLNLTSKTLLLDIGSGRGWPALYLAEKNGCRAALSDLPEPALAAALSRADGEGLVGSVSVTRATATHLPFATHTFDAVTHTDTLCCLGKKLSVLRACRRVLRRGGRMGFFTIFVPSGLSERDYRRALRSGPSFVSSQRRDHLDLLRSAGFQDSEEMDVTADFLVTARAWYDGRERYRDDLIVADGRERFEERQHDSRVQIEAIESGLLRRALFVAS